MNTAQELREELLGFVQQDLIGPANGATEILEDDPKIRYMAGVLFPQQSARNDSDAVSGVEDSNPEPISDEPDAISSEEIAGKPTPNKDDSEVDTEYDEAVTLANTYRPSAIGLSFMTATSVVKVLLRAHAGIYVSHREKDPEKDYVRTTWRRHELELPTVELDLARASQDQELGEGLRLRVLSRKRSDGQHLVTASMYNSTREHSRNALTFFQVGFVVGPLDKISPFVEYRTLEGLEARDEELALEMMYRNRCVFAIGHGCAAGWTQVDGSRAESVSTQVLPSVVVPPVVPMSKDAPCLDMQFLRGDCDNPQQDIPVALGSFCDDYADWIDLQVADAERLSDRFARVATANIDACRLTLERMRAGVALLASGDADALTAFMLVNRVMMMQQYHSRLRRKLDDPWTPLPTEYTSDWTERRGYWRGFQLAFLLLNLPGLTESTPITVDNALTAERDLVDLIWFPTGGGKTEAYLAVTAFVIFLARLRGDHEGGCRVLMRYTLRLLTSQQFQRATSLIAACELIRRRDPETFGTTPISIGLWVGMSLTPNDENDALYRLAQLARKKGDSKNPFQLLACPWCGTEFDNPKRLGYQEHLKRQVFICPTHDQKGEECPFSTGGLHLPVSVVDETIYANPPTLLIGTADKFAMLAWRELAGNIFEKGGGPELIIQDELHLISGPLGSMVGLYEGVIDYLCSRAGRRPKIIASTATIRRAREQCRALYDRPVAQFPPPGLDVSDSFFASEDRTSAGRIYVGFLPTASSSPLTAQIRSVVSLQQGALLVAGEETADDALDPYWTLVQYFGSLKELGRAATFLTADIPEFLPTMHRRYGLVDPKRRFMRTSEELTGRRDEDEIPKILKRLEVRYRQDADRDEQALDTVLATNMISVGVDIDRLGLMMVVTQPKGTSEYIQATSRVGRSQRSPGLIFTLYNTGRPRDRSHYEQFRSYHEAFYKFVEPASVTPFAPPAMRRALHAVVVVAARHVAGWKRPRDFDRDDEAFREVMEFLRDRVRSIDPDHLFEFDAFLSERLEEWELRRPESWGDLSGRREEPGLMRVAGTEPTRDDPYSWEVPTSMRNVDTECGAEVIARYPDVGATA